MSEIIHRGREINGKTWYKGYYVQYHDNVAGKDVGYILTSDGQGMPPGFGSFAWNAVDPATVVLRWTRMRLKTLNAARVGTGNTAQRLKKTRTANGLYAVTAVEKSYGATP